VVPAESSSFLVEAKNCRGNGTGYGKQGEGSNLREYFGTHMFAGNQLAGFAIGFSSP